MKTEISNRELGSILLCAFRYSLGRRTYVTAECVDWLTEYWHLMKPWQDMIKREISHAIEHEMAGDNCDIEGWKKILLLPTEEI